LSIVREHDEESMNWSALYESPWQHPGIAFIGLAVALAFALGTNESLFPRWFRILLIVEISLDAWLGGPLSPIPAKHWLRTAVLVASVILGDARFFWLAWMASKRVLLLRHALVLLASAFVIPTVSYVAKTAGMVASDRSMFLLYESMFAILALVLTFALGKAQRLSRALAIFQWVQYTIWLASDIAILADVDFGYATRIIANTMYYALFIPFAIAAFRGTSPKDVVR
jgi:hypothetical protein